jgi:N-carbamoyl-L-amino-acid hydrolase
MAIQPKPKLPVQPKRIHNDLKTLEEFTDPNEPYTRRAFSEFYIKGREWLAKRMEDAGLEVRIDAASNLIGHLKGKQSGVPILMMGSHTDTVEAGGRFDGIVGVIGALEVVRSLRDAGISLQHSLEIVDFTCEEPTLPSLTPMGSRIMAGDITTEMVATGTTHTGDSLVQAINILGGDAGNLEQARRQPGDVVAYLELHIEQGKVLEQGKYPVGVVTAVAGPYRGSVTITGQADHAGATPMPDRKDALPGAAELILAVERIAKTPEFSPDAVGTTGWIQNHPNMVNVIPGEVTLRMEFRSTELKALESMKSYFESELGSIAKRRGLSAKFEWQHNEAPVKIPDELQNIVAQACKELDLPVFHLPSRASHDAARLAHIMPVGMVFIPCKDGKSHTPDEWAELDDIVTGTQVLGRSLLLLDET